MNIRVHGAPAAPDRTWLSSGRSEPCARSQASSSGGTVRLVAIDDDFISSDEGPSDERLVPGSTAGRDPEIRQVHSQSTARTGLGNGVLRVDAQLSRGGWRSDQEETIDVLYVDSLDGGRSRAGGLNIAGSIYV